MAPPYQFLRRALFSFSRFPAAFVFVVRKRSVFSIRWSFWTQRGKHQFCPHLHSRGFSHTMSRAKPRAASTCGRPAPGAIARRPRRRPAARRTREANVTRTRLTRSSTARAPTRPRRRTARIVRAGPTSTARAGGAARAEKQQRQTARRGPARERRRRRDGAQNAGAG